MPTVTMPNPAATATERRVQRSRHGRRHATSATAAAAQRNHATAAGSVVSNRKTASAAPTYCDTAPTTKNIGTDHAGTRVRRRHARYSAALIASTRSLASPKSIWVFSRKNSGFCTPA